MRYHMNLIVLAFVVAIASVSSAPAPPAPPAPPITFIYHNDIHPDGTDTVDG
jgi:hypothetical protein